MAGAAPGGSCAFEPRDTMQSDTMQSDTMQSDTMQSDTVQK